MQETCDLSVLFMIVQISLDKMKKFANEIDKTQYDYDYVITHQFFFQKRNISFELP